MVPKQSQNCTAMLVDFEFTVFRIQYFSNHNFNPSIQAVYHCISSLRKGPHKNITLNFSLLLADMKKLEKENILALNL